MNEVARMEDRQELERMPEQPSAITPMTMIDRALATGAAPETLEKLLALQERWEASQGRKAFDEAMAAAKAEIPTIRKNRTVDFTSVKGRTHYQHEDLAEIARTVNPILSKHGLSYRFRTSSNANEPVTVTCIVSHRLGYSEENTLSAGKDESGNKNSIQAVGSTLTYLQRMTLKAALGLAAAEDDDGKASGMGEAVSDDQLMELESLIEEVAADRAKFCKFLGVDSLASLPAKQFQRAKSSLEAKRQKGGAS
jgi:hypothetical protein